MIKSRIYISVFKDKSLSLNWVLVCFAFWGGYSTLSAAIGVNVFDDSGWNSDDTRSSSGANILNNTSHAPASGGTLDAAQVSSQIDWKDFAGAFGNLGGVHFDTNEATGSQKSTLSVIDSGSGLAATSVLLDPSFVATYRWQNNDTTAAGLSMKFGIQSTEYGASSGESQEGFAATRSGEAVWDLILVFDPTANDQNSTTDGALLTTTVDANSNFFLFPQAGNSYWGDEYAASSATLGISAGSHTLAEWAAMDIDGAGSGTTTWGDVLFGAGADISNLQFGMGSGNENAATTLDYAAVSFLNGGERYDFVEAARYDGGGSDTADYSDAANWSGVTPGAAQNLVVDVAGTTDLTVSGLTQNTRSFGVLQGTTNLTIENGANLVLNTSENGTLSVSPGAALNVDGDGHLVASVLESAGSVQLAVTADLDGGATAHPTRDSSTSRYGIVVHAGGSVTLQNGAGVTVTQDDLTVGVRVGEGTGTGTLTIESGASLTVGNTTDFGVNGLTSNGFFHVGDWGSTGSVNQTGGSFELIDGSFNLGNQAGDGTYNLSGGTATLTGGLHSLGRNTGARTAGSGTLNISGGEFIVQNSVNNGGASFILGDRDASSDPLDDGAGLVHQTGGVFRVSSGSNLYLGGYGASTYNLEGGVLEIGGSSLLGNFGSATTEYAFNLQGGTIRVIGSNLNSSVDLNVVDLDATPTASFFDTNGFDANLSGDISGDGGFIKQGLGALTFSGSSREMAYVSVEEGTLSQTSGNTTVGALLVGAYPSGGGDSDGRFVLSGGTFDVTANNGVVYIGSGSSGMNTGLVEIDGGTLNLGVSGDPAVRVDFYVGAFGSTGTATVTQTDGTVNKLSDLGVFHIGNQSAGVYNLEGGTINIAGDNGMVLGRSGSSGDGDGTLNISGGELIFTDGTDLLLGGAQDSEPMTGSGVVNQTGGLVSLRDGGSLVVGKRGAGIYNLDGGVLEIGGLNRLRSDGGSSQFNMGGGTIKFIAASSVGSGINPVLKAGTTSTLDTNGNDVSVSGGFSGSGNWVKTGAGKLSLLGVSTHTGSTELQRGTLLVAGTLGGSDLTVNNGTRLTGSGTISAFTEIDGTLAPGDSPGVISFTNGLSLGAFSTTEIEITANSDTGRGVNYDGINVLGGLTIADGATISLIFNSEGSNVNFEDSFWLTDHSWLLFDGNGSLAIASSIFLEVSADSEGNSLSSQLGAFHLAVSGDIYNLNFTSAVPEPSRYAMLLALASLGFTGFRRRRRGFPA